MTGKPKDPTRTYSPNWGASPGERRGGGNPKKDGEIMAQKFRVVNDEERKAILSLTPRERTEAILNYYLSTELWNSRVK